MKLHHLKTAAISLVFVALNMLLGCQKEQEAVKNPYYDTGLAAVINNNFNFTFFGVASQATGNTLKLTEEGPYTVFCPVNNAFLLKEINTALEVKAAAGSLINTVPYHLVKGKFNIKDLPAKRNQPVKSENGLTLYLSRMQNERDTVYTINGTRIYPQFFEASNGLLYSLDKILDPTVSENILQLVGNDATLTFFNAAIQRSGLSSQISNAKEYTIFAPSNDAFVNKGIVSIDAIYNMPIESLRDIIYAHIFEGRQYVYDYIMAADITNNTYKTFSLNKKELTISLIPDQVTNRFRGISLSREIQGNLVQANLIKSNMNAKNGVLHQIDQVLSN